MGEITFAIPQMREGGYISAFVGVKTDRFKAVSVGAGVTNWTTYYANTDIQCFTKQYFEVMPWKDPEIYQAASPMFYIKEAKTPALIQHGSQDARVPILQGSCSFDGESILDQPRFRNVLAESRVENADLRVLCNGRGLVDATQVRSVESLLSLSEVYEFVQILSEQIKAKAYAQLFVYYDCNEIVQEQWFLLAAIQLAAGLLEKVKIEYRCI